eukprot:scaffold5.g972.t1
MQVALLCGHVAAAIWLLWRRARAQSAQHPDDELSAVEAPSSQPASRSASPLSAHRHAEAVAALQAEPPPLRPPRLPPPLEATGWEWVASREQLAAAVAELGRHERIALDTEHHSQHSYTGVTCLLQLSAGGRDFLVDCLALGREDMALLAPVLSSPSVCKAGAVQQRAAAAALLAPAEGGVQGAARELGVVHGGGNDVTWLQRDFGLFLVLGYQQRSLGALLGRFCGVEADKAAGQRADWRQRPLPPALLDYARADVHYLLYIADWLGEELLRERAPWQHHHHRHQQRPPGQQSGGQEQAEQQAARGEPPAQARGEEQEEQELGGRLAAAMAPGMALHKAVHRSQALSLSAYAAPRPEAAASAAALALLRQHLAAARAAAAAAAGGAAPPPPALARAQARAHEALADCLHALCAWRDAAARSLDESPHCVLPDRVLLLLAVRAPRTAGAVRALLTSREEEACVHYAASPAACRFPAHATEHAGALAAALDAAAAGRAPWACPEASELLHPQPGGAAPGSKAARKRQDPEAFRQKLAQRFAAKGVVYENCVMLSLSGELLCHTDRKAEPRALHPPTQVADDPLTVRLTFQHQTGDQRHGVADFYTTAKQNHCVGCGEEGHYLRYRVIPSCYRRAFPLHMKSHRSHDIVLLCVGCHEVACTASEQLKRQLALETGIPLLPPLAPHRGGGGASSTAANGAPEAANGTASGTHSAASAAATTSAEERQLHPYHVRRCAMALQGHAADIPPAKRREMEAVVRRYFARQRGASPAPLAGAAGGEEPPLSEAELLSGLLAGMALKTRRRTLRRWLKQGRALPPPLGAEAATAAAAAAQHARGGTENGVPAEVDEEEEEQEGLGEGEAQGVGSGAGLQAREAAPAAAEAGATAPPPREQQAAGHLWHGHQLVTALLERGGDAALLELSRRFRQQFVDVLQPKHLPPGWTVDHAAKREFGELSVYRGQ